jgi:hypothetical protein
MICCVNPVTIQSGKNPLSLIDSLLIGLVGLLIGNEIHAGPVINTEYGKSQFWFGHD